VGDVKATVYAEHFVKWGKTSTYQHWIRKTHTKWRSRWPHAWRLNSWTTASTVNSPKCTTENLPYVRALRVRLPVNYTVCTTPIFDRVRVKVRFIQWRDHRFCSWGVAAGVWSGAPWCGVQGTGPGRGGAGGFPLPEADGFL